MHYSNCELDSVTGIVTCDMKCAKMRKYRPREELGLSLVATLAGTALFTI